MKHLLFFVIFALFHLGFQVEASGQESLSAIKYAPKYEWRAVWVSTLNNIDWPSKPGLDAETQKKELIEYLDLFKSLNFNAVVLQVRPTADALYRSEYEPWSIFLTGNQTKPPVPFYDPLQFAVEQAHKRGMELHAWLTPYRITQDTTNLKDLAPDHLYNTRPELFLTVKEQCHFNPSLPESRDFVAMVVKDIVLRYNIDGIHFNDFSYPDTNFNVENTSLLVEQIHQTIKEIKPYVKFGISHPSKDSLLTKWVDYILPDKEKKNQVDTIHVTLGYKGICVFTANSLKTNSFKITEILKNRFKYPSIPGNILLDDQKYSTPVAPTRPIASLVTNQNKIKEVKLSWTSYPGSYLFVIYKIKKGDSLIISNPENILDILNGDSYLCTEPNVAEYDYYITALSRYAKESEPALFKKQNIITKNINRQP